MVVRTFGCNLCDALCRLRPAYTGPILMMTARGTDAEIAGLDTGADDYVVKPVRPAALVARIRSLLRRSGIIAGAEPEQLAVAGLEMHRAAREAKMHGEPMTLTTTEFELLWLLASHAGKVLTRESVLARLSGLEYDGLNRTMDNHVSKLRQKIGDDPRNPTLIKTVRGVGYVFAG